jgi:hypothetical protein
MLQTKVVENIKTHVLCSVTFFLSKIVPSIIYIMWEKKNCTAGQATHDNITRRMRIACWIPKATDTHSECVILIAFPTVTTVTRTRPTVKLYVHYPCCLPSKDYTCLFYIRTQFVPRSKHSPPQLCKAYLLKFCKVRVRPEHINAM